MSDTLPTENGDALASFIRGRDQDNLRLVASYRQDGEIRYNHVRNDLGKPDDDFDEEWGSEVLIQSFEREVKEKAFGAGSLECTVQFFESATVVNFHHETGDGLVAVFEPVSETFTRDIVDQCRDIAGLR